MTRRASPNREVATGVDLPLHLEEVTPQWLTQALATRFPGARVAEATRTGDRFGTAASARFELRYADAGQPEGLPSAVYVKGGFDDKWRNRVWQALQQEARFYAEIAPSIDLNIPDCYFSGISDAPQGIVVLEDLAQRGVRYGANLAPVSVDDVAAVLEGVAHMHAQWWGDKRLPQYIEWGTPQRVYLKWLYRPKHWDELVQRKYGALLVQSLGDPDTAVRSLETLWSIMDAKPRTLVHGDLHGGNIFYELDGRPGFYDWQLAFAGNHVHDMAWIIVTAFTVEQRRMHEREMIEHYLSVLKSLGAPAPSFDEAWLAHRQNMAHAIASYGCAPYDNGPPEVIEGAAERVLHAAVDHDVLAALGLSRG